MVTEGRTRRAIVRLLKQEGALGSAALARRLKLTPMAVRQHLYQLQREKLVVSEERPVPAAGRRSTGSSPAKPTACSPTPTPS